MRHLILLAATLLCTAAASAVEKDQHGIITQQPEGTLRLYQRTGSSTWASLYFMDASQDGILAEVVFSEDGTKAYFHNIISHAATGAWVEGDVEGNTITVPLGQVVNWWDEDDNGNKNYGMQLARVKVNGNIDTYTVDTKGSVTFTIDGNDLRLNDTSGDTDNKLYDGLGLVYTGAFANEWSYYLDYETVMHFKDVTPVTLPEGVETETFSMEYTSTSGHKTGQLVDVAFVGQDIYIHGASHEQLPDAWMRGTVNRDHVVFPLQYAGHTVSYMLYFCGVYPTYAQGDDGYWNWFYGWEDGSITFDFDQRKRILSAPTMALAANSSETGIDRAEIMIAPTFRPFEEIPATPAEPSIAYYQDMGAFSILMLDVPLLDTEGNFLNPSKVSYQLYVDDDEPYTLYPDEYKRLSEPIDEVPYFFSDEEREAFNRSYIYEKGSYIYLFQKGMERIGIQTIYRGGGEEHRSAINYYKLDGDHIADTPKATAPVSHYDLMGRPVANGHRGLTITRRADGSVVKHWQ